MQVVGKPTDNMFTWLKCYGSFIDSIFAIEIVMSYIVEPTMSMLMLFERTTYVLEAMQWLLVCVLSIFSPLTANLCFLCLLPCVNARRCVLII